MLVWFQGLLRNYVDQELKAGSLHVRSSPCLVTQDKHINQNSFTVELLIGLVWDAEQTLYLYFLDLIKLHWELYVFITSFPTP